MSKKIVVITGSPCKNGNSFAMTNAFIHAAKQNKNLIDKLYSFFVANKDISGKERCLIACCEEEDLSVMDGIRIPIERSAALLKWHIAGEVLISGVLNAGDIDKTDGCHQAAELAEKI